MCLPIKCIEKVLGFSAFILCFISLAGIGFGIYASLQQTDFWKTLPLQYHSSLIIVLIIISVGLLLISIIGIIAGLKRNRCCSLLYLIAIIPLALVFFVFAIVAQALVTGQMSKIKKMKDLENCGTEVDKNLEWIQKISKSYDAGYEIFGKIAACKVQYKNDDFKKYLVDQKLSEFDKDKGKFNVMDCLPDDAKPDQGLTEIVQFMEKSLKCAGLCKPKGGEFKKYYLFSKDVDDFEKSKEQLSDNKGCLTKITDYMSKYGTISFITAYAIGAFLILQVLLTFCKCCHPEYKKSDKTMYQKMDYIE